MVASTLEQLKAPVGWVCERDNRIRPQERRSIFSSDSISHTLLEVLITTPTFNSVKGSALGTSHVRVAGKVLVAPPKNGLALSVGGSPLAVRIVSVQLCFFANSLKLFLKTAEILIGKFF